MKHTKIKDLLSGSSLLQEVVAKGWVRTFRNNQFIALNDGSTIHNIQCVLELDAFPEDISFTTGQMEAIMFMID